MRKLKEEINRCDFCGCKLEAPETVCFNCRAFHLYGEWDNKIKSKLSDESADKWDELDVNLKTELYNKRAI